MMVLVVMGPDIFEHASSISRPWVSTIGEMAGAPPPPPIPPPNGEPTEVTVMNKPDDPVPTTETKV